MQSNQLHSQQLRRNSPIYVVGLPRTGTTWLASILNTAWGIKYVYEPFNRQHVPEAAPYFMKYLRADDHDPEFMHFCDRVFSGQLMTAYTQRSLAKPYSLLNKRLHRLPGRVMVKDVHSGLAIECIDQHISPNTVIILRHPCATISSWLRSFKFKGNRFDLFQKLFQPQLLEDHLKPFEALLHKEELLQKMAVSWGAAYNVILQQQKRHPDWIVVKHEDLCQEPEKMFRRLFETLNLRWTHRTDKVLYASTSENSGKTYVPKRISSQEPHKWKSELTSQQIDQILELVTPFGNPYPLDY